MSNYNDGNQSTDRSSRPELKGPIKQHKRMALGEKIDGMKSPNGPPASTTCRIGNSGGKNY
jgi:hypothetical protein